MKKGLFYGLGLGLLLAVLSVSLWRGLPLLRASAAVSPAAGEGSPDRYEASARRILAGMTREEKVWQMLVLFPQQVTGDAVSADAQLWQESLAARPVGGIVLDGDNMESEAQLRALLTAAGTAGAVPLLTCVDEEGGAVARVAYNLGAVTDFEPMFTYRGGGAETAFANARTLGSELSSLGFNVDFAPVADVWTNPDNAVIGRRAYSDDAAEAAALISAAVQGFHAGGTACVLKHFPGHGDTAEDSHLGAAYCYKSAAELRECELLPFAAGIAAGADMVMMGHITVPALDSARPATLSPAVVTGLLRQELGYDGVVITDALQMRALNVGGAESAVLAVEAGCDLLLAPEDPAAVAAAVLDTVDEARLDESVLRILQLKLRRGIVAAP